MPVDVGFPKLSMSARVINNCKCAVCAQAVDVLTPLGRGQALLMLGPAASGKTSLALDAILGQYVQQQPGEQSVRCIYAAVRHR